MEKSNSVLLRTSSLNPRGINGITTNADIADNRNALLPKLEMEKAFVLKIAEWRSESMNDR
jgi:hypothetical protein